MREVLSGKALADALRRLCDAVQRRLWVASPYIGRIDAIRRVLGRGWWDRLPKDAVRILTDADERNINVAAINTFRAKGPVKHLRGLHAKLYIIDDDVLLTSANLTKTAFSCRYEIGIILSGPAAQDAIAEYEKWWDAATDVSTKQLDRIAAKRGKNVGEDAIPGLAHLYDLPADPGDITIQPMFADYEPFRTAYRQLSAEYAKFGRAWPNVPLFLEVDAFLDYLFHHNGKPSHPYTKKQPRRLSPTEQRSEIATHARAFQKWADPAEANDRLQRATALQSLVNQKRIGSLTTSDIRSVLSILNCMHDERVKRRVLENNDYRTIRDAWKDLLYGSAQLPERMSSCAARLFGFKRSGVQELLGWYDSTEYPIRNANTNAGMRFLGYDVRAD